MAVLNKLTGKYEAKEYMSYDGTLLVGEGDTKAEAIKDLKEGKALWRKLELNDTGRKTKARNEIAEYIQETCQKSE